MGTGSLGTRRPSPPAPPGPGPGRGGGVDGAASQAKAGLPFCTPRTPPQLPSPFRPEAPGWWDRKGLAAPGPAASGHLPRGPGSWHPGAGAAPDTGRRGPAPSPGGGLVPRPGDAAARAPGPAPGAVPGGLARGRCLGSWPRDSSLPREPLPVAGRTNHRRPMTTRPYPSRPGPGETTEGEPGAASLLSSTPPLRARLLCSAAKAQLSLPLRRARRDCP